jgi:hypothetical protein
LINRFEDHWFAWQALFQWRQVSLRDSFGERGRFDTFDVRVVVATRFVLGIE